MTTELQLIEAILEEFNSLNPKNLTINSNLLDVLGWSSLNILIVRAKIKEEFNIDLSDEEIKKCTSLNDLLKKINSK